MAWWWEGLVIHFGFGVAVFAAVFAHVAEEVGGVNKVVEVFVVLVVDFIFGAHPADVAFVHKDDVFANTHHRVHVVGVDDGGDAKFVGDVPK